MHSFLLLILAAPPEPAPADLEFFERRVRPLLVRHCYSCHSAEAKKIRGGLRVDSRAALLKGGDRGPAIIPGKPEASLMLRALGQQDESLQMPPKGKFADPDMAVLAEWVRRGAPFPDAGTTATASRTIDIEAGKKFWSFQPLKFAQAPRVKNEVWPRTRIDTFLLAEMEKRSLAPAAEAGRRTLVRRTYFDLIGLPPSPEEMDAVLSDQSPDWYEKLVERLLTSPQHGERWARYWLDLVRYCDVPEEWVKRKGLPHFYRDWVVRALNADVPYDRFVTLQLAADLLSDAQPADRAALGFLGLSPVYWKELKLDQEVIKNVVAEEWEERIHTLGGTFLGLTLACARCHDHKFDPITQRDYYGLAGVFASIREADVKVSDRDTAPGVDEASLFVLPDGPHKTKVEYKPGVSQDIALHIRGNPSKAGPVVPRRFLTVLSPSTPRALNHGSGRLDLAKAITGEAGPLAARVIVNRVWAHHFGAALVDTPSDFGIQGSRPTHPELLDDLAQRFVASGWSLRWLHREIVLSAAYRQSSSNTSPASDPDNRYLTHANRRRLDVESWRDAMLAVTGTLERRFGEPARELEKPDNYRRTLYGLIKRRELSDVLRLYDFPDPTTHSARRTPTTTALQQLFVLNSPFMQQQSTALAARIERERKGDVEGGIRRAYALLFSRPPTEGELKIGREFIATANWREYAQVLLGSNEFLFVD